MRLPYVDVNTSSVTDSHVCDDNAGVHCNVGGSYEDRGLSDHALRWIVDEATAFGIGFEPHALDSIAPDHAGRLYRSRKGIYMARARHVRTVTGPVHSSARQRWEQDIDGYREKCKPLARLLASVGGDWTQIEIEP